ncbi:MAG: glycosyltransferase family 1 protein [Prevotella sp.]|nr:glycosyltransferase family 1 protein [Prevotella sp.]
MRILLLGEYSNVHATLGQALKTLGHDVTVLSNGDFWKDYPRDIDLVRRPGKIGGLRYFWKVKRLLPHLRDYDVVQLINPMFLELKANRLFSIYRTLRHQNANMFLGGFGMDWYWLSTCRTEKHLRYSDFNIGDTLRTDACAMEEVADWCDTPKERLNRMIAEDCDGIICGLYEYWTCYDHHFKEKSTYIPFPIDCTDPPVVRQDIPTQLKVFIGINKNRSAYKGTDIMLREAQAIAAEHPEDMILTVAESVPFEQYQRLLDDSDVLLDQLYSYTPAMNALMAMSKGILCIGGGEPEHYEFLREHHCRPILNVKPEDGSVRSALEYLISHKEEIPRLRQESQAYVIRHHDACHVAEKYLRFWNERGRNR